MLQVIFKRLSAKNFLSIGEESLDVDFKTGLNIITGKNYDKLDRTNGVGKSTVADALHFGLFGSTIRELTKENIVNNITEGKCLIVIEFDTIDGVQVDQYKIERSINPSKCSLHKNGEDITRSGIPQTNELIQGIIHSTPDLFQNGVIMTVNNTVPFMSQKKTDKRKFVEGILNLGTFGEMLLQARADYNETKKTFDIESARVAEVEKTIAMLQAQRSVFETEKAKKLTDVRKKIAEYELEAAELAAKIVPVATDGLDKINTEIAALKDQNLSLYREENDAKIQVSHFGMTIKGVNERLKDLETKRGICQFCSKSIDELLCDTNEKTKQLLLLELDSYQKQLANAQAHIPKCIDRRKTLEVSLSKATEQVTEHKLKVSENQSLQARVDQLKKWIKVNKDMEDLIANSKGDFDSDLLAQETRFKGLKEKINGFKERLEIIDAAKFIVSEEGVKSILVKKILKILNSKLSFYLKKMEANCVITFNEYFEEKIVNEKGKECVYWNFSGAERKSIDLACLFTFMDIRRLQGDLSINVSMYDELLDSSMDEKGVDLVLDILRERVDKHKEAVYIISHRRESVKHVTGDVIFIEKRDGISRRVPYLAV